MQRIDAHVHLWHLDDGRSIWIRDKIAALHRDFTLDELRAAQDLSGVSGSIVVQAAVDPDETDALLTAYANEPRVRGIVGWVDLEGDPQALSQRLTALRKHPKFVGVRVQPPSAFDSNWLHSPAVARGIGTLAEHGLVVDFLVNCTQLTEFQNICQAAPGITAVLNHGGRPFVMTGDLTRWQRDIAAVARNTDAICKLSGLIERAGVEWTPDLLIPWIGTLLDTFGPERLVYASNWPVMTVMGTYGGWLEALEIAFDTLGVTQVEREAMYRDNAVRIYGLAQSGNA